MENQSLKKVNFFIVGAPKSGTTFIQKHLNKHPNLFLPEEEPVYMSTDLNDLCNYKSLESYLNLFSDNLKDGNNIICGEKSTNYLYSNTAHKEIFRYNQKAKIIICLRNPIYACFSYHNHNKVMGFEIINDFSEAWNSQHLRISSNYKIPLWANNQKLRYQYKNIYNYNTHVLKYLNTFGKENVKIIFFEDIKNNKDKVFFELFKFLNVKNFLITNYKIENFIPKINVDNSLKNKIYLYKVFFLKKNSVRKFTKIIKTILRIKSFSFLRKYTQPSSIKLHEVVSKNKDLDENIKNLLLHEFRESIQDLSKTLNQNFNHWLN